MNTFETFKYNLTPFQEGNVGDFIDWDFAENFPLTMVSDVTLVVIGSFNKHIFTKKLSDGCIIITGQNLRVPLNVEDTKGKAGNIFYEFDFKNLNGDPFATIKGESAIECEINKL